MKMLNKNDCLNELLKETAAAKCPFLEFITAMLAVILINVRNEIFSIDRSIYDACAEIIKTDCLENEKMCAHQRSLINQNCLLREMPLSINEILVSMHRIIKSN